MSSLLLQSWITEELPKLGPDLPKTSRTEQRAVLVVVKGTASQTHWSGQTLLPEARSAALESESESHSVVSDCLQLHGLYSPWNSPGQNIGAGGLSLLQWIFPTQGSNPGLLHYRWILYQLSHKGSPRILDWVAYPFCSGSSQPRNRTGVSCIAGRFFTNWAIREAKWEKNERLRDDLTLDWCRTQELSPWPGGDCPVSGWLSASFPMRSDMVTGIPELVPPFFMFSKESSLTKRNRIAKMKQNKNARKKTTKPGNNFILSNIWGVVSYKISIQQNVKKSFKKAVYKEFVIIWELYDNGKWKINDTELYI